jgi:predicted phosphodiesterase
VRLGIIADIHEDVPALQSALKVLDDEGSDTVIALGDIADDTSRLDETCQILLDAGAVGVWGNHEFGMCFDPDPRAFVGRASCTRQFMASLKPSLCFDDCRFTHVEPHLDPCDLYSMWRDPTSFTLEEQLEKTFTLHSERVFFYGHIHRWLVATSGGEVEWADDQLHLRSPARYSIALSALSDGVGARRLGHFALYDTDTEMLTRFQV